MSLRAALITLLLLPALAACGGEPEADAGPAPQQAIVPERGQCVAGEIRDRGDFVPDFDTVVPCSQQHRYEITSVVPVPQRFLDESSPAASQERRNALASVTSDPQAVSNRMFRSVDCSRGLIEVSGLGAFPEVKKAGAGKITPVVGASQVWKTVAPADLWEEGHHVAVCSIRLVELMASPDERPLLGHFLERSMPASLRVCLDEQPRQVRCGKPHMYEQVLTADFAKVFGGELDRMSSTQQTLVRSGWCKSLLVLAEHAPRRGAHALGVQPDGQKGQCYVVADEGVFPGGFQTFGRR